MRVYGLLAVVLWTLVDCGEDENICEQSVAKINACQSSSTYTGDSQGQMKFAGDCNDAMLLNSGESVAFQSWSELYVPCEIDPATCLCPDLPWYDAYKPPDAITTASP